MNILNQHVARSTFYITGADKNIVYISFVWEGSLVSVMWDSAVGEIPLVLPDDVCVEYEEMSSFIKETLNEQH